MSQSSLVHTLPDDQVRLMFSLQMVLEFECGDLA